MSTSVAASTPVPFQTLAALRGAHTELLNALHGLPDTGELPAPFLEQVEALLRRGRATGALLDLDEDRSDAQVLLNYWTTVLYDAGVAVRASLLEDFDAEAAAKSVGEGSPYRGLRPFGEEDAPVFFGRRRLVRRMAEVLEKHRLLAVVGLSGSGKSSVVRAGLLPELQQGGVPGAESWHTFPPVVPGSDPLGNLARATRPDGVAEEPWRTRVASTADALVEAYAGTTVLLLVDQLEELFTIAPAEQDRARFVEHLVRLATAKDSSHRVVVTLRSDFEPQLGRYPALQALLGEDTTVRVPPLDPAGLRTAVEKPAARQGLSFEPGLIEELVHQVVGEPAGLPLLQFTLQKLWEKREGRVITWSAYRALGGNVREILARSADATYNSFNLQEDRDVVKAVFGRLVEPAAAGEVTSHRVPRASLYDIGAARGRVDRVVDTLLADGLLRLTPGATPAEDHVEVTHEALIRNWPQLVDWVEETRQSKRNRLQLAAAAKAWEEHQRDPSYLLKGLRLAEAQEYGDLAPLESDLVAESARSVKDSRRRQWQWIAGILAMLVLLLGWALLQTGVSTGLRDKLFKQTLRAQENLRQAEAMVRRAEAQRANIDRDTREARARYDETVGKLREAETELAAMQLQLESARAEAAKAEEDRKQLETAKEQAETQLQQSEHQQNQLRQVTGQLLAARPAIAVRDGSLAEVPPEWKILAAHRAAILAAARSVGAVESARGLTSGFLVADDVVMLFEDPGARPQLIDFADRHEESSLLRFKLVELLGRQSQVGAATDAVYYLWRVRRESTAGKRLPPPLRIARRPPQKGAGKSRVGSAALYAIGYPVDATTAAYQSQGVAGIVKRVMPGYLLSVDEEERLFFHDCYTVGGTAGAPIFDLESGNVVGFHIGGEAATAEGPGVKMAIALWMYAEHPLFRRLGIRFEE